MYKIIFGDKDSIGVVFVKDMAEAMAFGLILDATERFAVITESDELAAADFTLANLPTPGELLGETTPRKEWEVQGKERERRSWFHRRWRRDCSCAKCSRKVSS